MPDSLAVILWNTIILLVLVMHSIAFPVTLCFSLNTNDNDSFQYFMYFFPIMLFIIDMVIGFNTGIFEFGLVVTNRKIIFKAYLKDKLVSQIALVVVLIAHQSFEKSIIVSTFGMVLRLRQIFDRVRKVN